MWFRRGGTGDRNPQGIDRERADNEGDESEFGEHDDGSVVRGADNDGTRPEVWEVGEKNWDELHSG